MNKCEDEEYEGQTEMECIFFLLKYHFHENISNAPWMKGMIVTRNPSNRNVYDKAGT
jgi:hypothetical protein